MSLEDADVDLKATFDVGQDSRDLKATFDVGQGSANLYAKFEAQATRDLFAKFTVRHSASQNLFAKFRAAILFSGKPADLFAEFFVGYDGEQDLFAKFETYPIEDLLAEFIVRHSASRNLFAEFRVSVFFTEGWADLKALAFIVNFDSEDLLSEFVVRQSASQDLKSELIVRNIGSRDLFSEATIRHSASADLLAEFTVRHTDSVELKGIFIPRRSASLNLFAKFEAIPNEDLKGIFTVRHSAIVDLKAFFYVRFPYRLWTNRRYINGVVDAAEDLIGDAKLEYVVEGVMEDIQTWLLANELSYAGWDNITLVPVAIRRAATYGTIASLFSRKTQSFRSRVIRSVPPVVVTVKGDDQAAMEHWEGKYNQMLELYQTTRGSSRLWVSTQDEEPVFSMEDLPPTVDEYTSWHEWLQQRDP